MSPTITSFDSPLRIDSYILSDTGGQIGMTICPGKNRPGSISGDWDRDLALDLQVVKDWGAEIVLTLLEDFEFAQVGVEALGPQVKALHMHWLHLPIPDKHAPTASFAQQWQTAGPLVHACLQRGGKILIHCMGGIGRTGTVAAQILMERGMAPDEAMVAIRTARRGAIETEVQEMYLLALRLPSVHIP
ncbi:MAG TPA: cyclin-dependent kinase inhibitor 3 family protein [Gallionella sp.]|nr:cyclin-dependent kinase inhibitor 3 family protein [Gallionella sp.]